MPLTVAGSPMVVNEVAFVTRHGTTGRLYRRSGTTTMGGTLSAHVVMTMAQDVIPEDTNHDVCRPGAMRRPGGDVFTNRLVTIRHAIEMILSEYDGEHTVDMLLLAEAGLDGRCGQRGSV